MTKQEILALIDAKVAGQGNQLDLGGGVVEALKEIVNAIPDASTPSTIVLKVNVNTSEDTLEVYNAMTGEVLHGVDIEDLIIRGVTVSSNAAIYRDDVYETVYSIVLFRGEVGELRIAYYNESEQWRDLGKVD